MLAHSLRPVFSGQGSRLLAANKSSTISNTAATASSQFILFHRNFTATTAKLASVDGGDSSTGEKSSEAPISDDYVSGKSGKRVKVKKRPSSYPRIYTKTGDGGRSSLYTGERRPKHDAVFEALGTTDELSSHIGLCREYALLSDAGPHPYVDQLQRIQCLLQDVGSCVATPRSSARQSHIESCPLGLGKRHTQEIEEWIDEYSKLLPPLDNFILPGGGKTSASIHVARSVCRRAERTIAPLVEADDVDPEVLKYVNRLSDFLFTIARLAARLDSKDETIYSRPPPPEPPGSAYSPLEGSTQIWKRSKTDS